MYKILLTYIYLFIYVVHLLAGITNRTECTAHTLK